MSYVATAQHFCHLPLCNNHLSHLCDASQTFLMHDTLKHSNSATDRNGTQVQLKLLRIFNSTAMIHRLSLAAIHSHAFHVNSTVSPAHVFCSFEYLVIFLQEVAVSRHNFKNLALCNNSICEKCEKINEKCEKINENYFLLFCLQRHMFEHLL